VEEYILKGEKVSAMPFSNWAFIFFLLGSHLAHFIVGGSALKYKPPREQWCW